MKIEINYDLFSKIAEANSGFSLNKTVKHTLFRTSLSSIAGFAISSSLEETMSWILYCFTIHTIMIGIENMAKSKVNRASAINELKSLSKTLKNIGVNTNYELLLKSHNYKTSYVFDFNQHSNSKLVQKKYIILPICDKNKEKEISLVQEHVVGTNKFVLSCGLPKKVLKLSYNPV